MQTLFFEHAWERTIAPADRQHIEHLFDQTKFEQGIHFTYIRDAINHKKETLVTVLIHNVKATPLVFDQCCISFTSSNAEMRALFSLPIAIGPFTSMPWTFIFPAEASIDNSPAYKIVPEPKNR